jgi:predicted metal-dependent phosphoesterase TrpH
MGNNPLAVVTSARIGVRAASRLTLRTTPVEKKSDIVHHQETPAPQCLRHSARLCRFLLLAVSGDRCHAGQYWCALIFDLHSHTTCSDGALTPRELVSRAAEKNVDTLAITDHDTVEAFCDVPVIDGPLHLIAGIEFSTHWEHTGIHVLGLNIDLYSDAIRSGTKFQTDARLERARRIGQNLEKQGIENAFEGASALSGGSYIGRPHFARYLINTGTAASMEVAFKKYLGAGKAGDVREHWAELPQIIQWIREANGIPVLAHPLKYKLTRTKLKRLVDGFIHAGGQGIEVVSGQQLPQHTLDMAMLCEEKGLLASCGSDFHMPGPWNELGVFAPLPDHVIPVWDRF